MTTTWPRGRPGRGFGRLGAGGALLLTRGWEGGVASPSDGALLRRRGSFPVCVTLHREKILKKLKHFKHVSSPFTPVLLLENIYLRKHFKENEKEIIKEDDIESKKGGRNVTCGMRGVVYNDPAR